MSCLQKYLLFVNAFFDEVEQLRNDGYIAWSIYESDSAVPSSAFEGFGNPSSHTPCTDCGYPHCCEYHDSSGAPVLFCDNDSDAKAPDNITGKIYNKKKNEYKGVRSYQANEAVRCYRDTHNNVDTHNQYMAYGSWDYRTRRKQMRVQFQTVVLN